MYKIKSFQPRDYQSEIVETTKENNTLVVLPTGTGKTKLAILTAIERLNQHSSNILIITPTKPLSAQIQREFKESTNIPKEQIILLTGEITPKKRQELWEQAIVTVATPQTIQKDVEAKRISLSPTSLLTIDECVTKDTKIRLALNKEITINDLFKKNIKKKKIYIESLNQKTGELEPTRLLKIHKIKSNKKIIKITTKNNNEIKITENHLILIKRNNKTKWIETKQLKLNDKIASSKSKKERLSNKTILNEKDIIKTFKKKQQELTNYYKKAIKLKEKNKTGSIKIARILKTKESTIQNYIYKPYRKPIPIHLIEKIKEENLLPLKYSNPKLKTISRITGHLYGDGWYYLSKNKKKVLGFSGKIEDLERIKKDLNLLNIKHQNIYSRITKSKINHIERGQTEVKGTSNSFHVTDSKLTRLIDALNIPSGNKVNKKIMIPNWLMKSPKSIKREFLSALMGSEAHKPINKKGTRQFYAIRLSFYKKKELKQNGIEYANQIKKLFNKFDVDCNISTYKGNIRKDNTESIKFLITISNSNENMIKFLRDIGYNYSIEKNKEANNILEYLIQKGRGLKLRKKLYTKANELRKKGLAYKKISEKLEVSEYIIRHWLFKEKPNHSSVEIEPYDIWKKQNKGYSNIGWEEIKEIKNLKKEKHVYDLTVKQNHNYIANNIIVHNCHRSRENFANTKVAQSYIKQSKFPIILALTASPGGTKEKIDEIRNNLSIEKIEIRTEEDIKEYIQEKKIRWLKVELSPKLKQLSNLIKSAYLKNLENLKKIGFTKPTKLINKRDLIILQARLRKELKNKNPITFYGISLTALLIKIDYASELIETQGILPLSQFWKKLETDPSKAAKNILKFKEIQQAISLTKDLEEKEVKHPKIYMLKGIIKKELEKDPKAKIIIFANYRNTIDEILNFIKKEPQIIPTKLIGQKSGLTQKEQLLTIKQFEKGTYNTLICSSIGEEGIDISGATTAIMYDQGFSSEIRNIQRKGRVGRLIAGNITLLLTDKTREMGYFWASKRKENTMQQTLKNIQKETQKTLV